MLEEPLIISSSNFKNYTSTQFQHIQKNKQFFDTYFGCCLFNLSCKVLLQFQFPGQIVIILIKLIIMLQSRISNRSNESAYNLPKKEQWAIIYEHRALQFEKAKSLEKLMSQEKKDNFKRQLDQQILSKKYMGKAEKAEDRKFYEQIVHNDQELKEKQEKERFQRFMERKRLEQANLKLMQVASDKKIKQKGKVYNIEIGLKSQIQKKQRSEAIRKDVVQTLDKQLLYKQQQKQLTRQQQDQLNLRNEQYQNDRFNNRSSHNKKYEQNQAVFNYYRDLYNKKMRKDRELEHKYVDEVQQKKEEDQNKKRQMDALVKEKKNIQMKDTLQKQIQLINYRRSQGHRTNPEQANYSFIGNIFRQKKAPFDKKQYSTFLQKQAEQQRMSKVQQHYMSEQQYKLNSNQLNKAISGQYTYDRYHDRSMGTVGDRMSLNQVVAPLQTSDAELVKSKLQNLRMQRNRSYGNRRNDLNQSLP